MCLALPGRIRSVSEDESIDRSGLVDFDGACKMVCLGLVPEADVGDYVIVHAGFAISRLDPDEASQSLLDFQEMMKLDAEQGF